MLCNCVQFIDIVSYKLNIHFFLSRAKSQWIFSSGSWFISLHLVNWNSSLQQSADQCKCTKYPFISQLEEKNDSLNNKQQQTFLFCTAALRLPSLKLCCHPLRAQPDKTRLSDHGIIITAWSTRFWVGGETFFFFYCSLKNTTIMSYMVYNIVICHMSDWHFLSVTRQEKSHVRFWEDEKQIFLKIWVMFHISLLCCVYTLSRRLQTSRSETFKYKSLYV